MDINKTELVKKTGLTFKEAYTALLNGQCVKRAEWLGYWHAEQIPGTDKFDVVMYCKNGDIVRMATGCDPMFTLFNVCADDWMIVDEKHRAEFDLIRESGVLNKEAK